MGMGTGAGFVLGDIAQVLEEEDLRQTGRAKKVYEAFLQREKLEEVAMPPCARCPSAAWTEIMGREQDILTAQARVHDLTVIGHPTHWGGLTNEVAGAMLVGSGRPAARSALAKAVGRSLALAITSPVERISGPSTGSDPGKRANGSTAALTLISAGRGCGSASSARVAPAASLQAASTRLIPIAFDANGTVRDARGFASST